MSRLYSVATTDRHETTNLLLPPIPEVVWAQLQETHLTNIYKTSTTETHKTTPKPEFRQRNEVESQTSAMKETSPQVSGSSTESFLQYQTGSTPLQSLNDSKKSQSGIQRHEMNMTANDNGDDHIFPPKTKNSLIEAQLVRDDIVNELYMPLSSTIFRKRKKEMVYVPLDSEQCITIDALVYSRAYVSAVA